MSHRVGACQGGRGGVCVPGGLVSAQTPRHSCLESKENKLQRTTGKATSLKTTGQQDKKHCLRNWSVPSAPAKSGALEEPHKGDSAQIQEGVPACLGDSPWAVPQVLGEKLAEEPTSRLKQKPQRSG